MNTLEYEMIDILKKLKEEYNVIEIKAEYENEGSRQVELMRLKDVASHAGLPIIIKIGGVEAVSDMYEALSIGVKGIIAPMAETAFATSKFLDAIDTFIPDDNRRDIQFAVNIETMTAYGNFKSILELPKLNLLSSITIGRVDFTGSLGRKRDFVDSETMLHYCTMICEMSRERGLRTALGGAISPESFSFVDSLVEKNLLDKYETRKIVYGKNGVKKFNEGLKLGIEFELRWLKSKRRYYHRITIEDEKRIEMLEKRVNG